MEDVLFDSIGSLIKSIEEHRVSAIINDPKGAVRSAAAATTITQNAEQLVGIVKAINVKVRSGDMKAVDNDMTSEVVETIFSSLHRWLGQKALMARLPKSHSLRSSKSRSVSSFSDGSRDDEKDYFAGDPWEDCDDLASEDLMTWLVEGFREGAAVRVDKAVGHISLKPVEKVVKLTPRQTPDRLSTDTVSTIAPSESMPATNRSLDSSTMPISNRSLDSDCSSSLSYGQQKDVLDCGATVVSRRLVPVVSQDDRRKPSHASANVKCCPFSRTGDAASQASMKKSFPGLLNPILDDSTDLPKGDMVPQVAHPASTWPKGQAPKQASSSCYCISCLLGLDCNGNTNTS
jgi:hypothetical protein